MSEATDANALAFTTAQTYEQLAQASLTELRAQTEKLHLTLRDTARRAIQESFGALHIEIETTTAVLQQLSRCTQRQALWIIPAATLTGLALGLGASLWLATSRTPIASDELPPPAPGNDRVVPRCRDSHQRIRPCVRVDVSAGPFGAHHDYYLLAPAEPQP